MNQHLYDRFLQRYGKPLTPAIMGRLCALATESKAWTTDFKNSDREHVWVDWDGVEVGMAWHRASRLVFTFLPPRIRRSERAARHARNRRSGRGW